MMLMISEISDVSPWKPNSGAWTIFQFHYLYEHLSFQFLEQFIVFVVVNWTEL